jgi:hypothetical protein
MPARAYTGNMDEILTWAEIEGRFPDEWVVIDDPEVTDDLEIVRGRVVYHGADREAAEAVVQVRRLASVAVLFVGPPIPEGAVAIL